MNDYFDFEYPEDTIPIEYKTIVDKLILQAQIDSVNIFCKFFLDLLVYSNNPKADALLLLYHLNYNNYSFDDLSKLYNSDIKYNKQKKMTRMGLCKRYKKMKKYFEEMNNL